MDLAVAFEGGVGDVAEEVVQQLVEQHRPQPLGQPGRVAHVDQQEGALLAPRLDVAAGEQVLQRAEAQQTADLEHHVGPHRHDHGEDHRGAERIVEALVARDVQAAHQHQPAQDHDHVEDDLQAEIGQQRQPAQAPQHALALDLEQHDRRGNDERGDDADQHPMPRHLGRLVIAEPGADQHGAKAQPEEQPPGPAVALRLHHGLCIPRGRSLDIDDPSIARLALCTHNIEGRKLMKKLLLAATAAIALTALGGTTDAQGKKTLAFVVNGASDFWKAAEAGVKKAQGELPNYNLTFKYPEQSSAAIQTAHDGRSRRRRRRRHHGQRRSIPRPSSDALNRIGGQVALFTTDSDAPNSKRIAYIGSSNIDAGKQAGQLDGQGDAQRRQVHGLRRPAGADNATRAHRGREGGDQGHQDRAGRRARRRHRPDARQAQRRGHAHRHPDINCMVGFYSYNTPRIYEALKDAGKLGQITIIGFDEDPITLGGVKEGTIVGTVVQQPYEWGYQGMKTWPSISRATSRASRPTS